MKKVQSSLRKSLLVSEASPFFSFSSCSKTFLLSTLLFSPMASAEFDEDAMFMMLSGDEELISIATGTPRPVSKSPAVASVITAENIRASGATTVLQALEQVPGLHIGASSLNRLKPVFSMRGIHTGNTPQILILVDGHEIPDTFSGSILPTIFLPIENVARIEVIRGPGSAVYGADAFAGVINIISKTDADINGAHAGIRASSFNTQAVWGQYGGEMGGWQVAASIEYNKSDGDKNRIIDSDLQTGLDAAFGTSASLAPGALDTGYESLVTSFTLAQDKWELQFNGWNQQDTGVGAGAAQALDPVGKTELYQYLFSLEYKDKNWLPNWSLNMDASYMQNKYGSDFIIFPPGSTLLIGSDGNVDFVNPAGPPVSFTDGLLGNPTLKGEVTHLHATTIYSALSAQQWRFNFGVKTIKQFIEETKNFGPSVIDGTVSPIDGTLTDVTGTSFVAAPNASRTVSYLSIQDEWLFDRDWVLTAGLRFDDYSDVGSTTNPRLSLVWNTRNDLTSKLLYGRAFRAPTFGELAAANNPIVIGNPNLAPEIINTFELAFDYKPTVTLNLLFNLFHYEIDGLIDYVDDDGVPGGSATAQNVINQNASGAELEIRWQASKILRLFANMAVQNAINKDTGRKVADAPRDQIYMGANIKVNVNWNAQLDAHAIMNRPRAAGDSRTKIADYNWFNLSINGRNFMENINLQIGIKNLFDSNAREPGPAGTVTVPSAIPNEEGRSIYFALSRTF